MTMQELCDLLADEPAGWAPLANSMLSVLTAAISERRLPPVAVGQATIAAAVEVLAAVNPGVALATLEAAREELEERFPLELAEWREATLRRRTKH